MQCLDAHRTGFCCEQCISTLRGEYALLRGEYALLHGEYELLRSEYELLHGEYALQHERREGDPDPWEPSRCPPLMNLIWTETWKVGKHDT